MGVKVESYRRGAGARELPLSELEQAEAAALKAGPS